jgi:hypothetical protein
MNFVDARRLRRDPRLEENISKRGVEKRGWEVILKAFVPKYRYMVWVHGLVQAPGYGSTRFGESAGK